MEINHHKTKGIRLLAQIDVSDLIKRLEDIRWDTASDFDANYNKNDGSALKDTQHSILKFSDKRKKKTRYFNTDEWPRWKDLLFPVMTKATEVYGYQHGFYPKVMFAKLPAQSFILPHTDGNLRGHVPHKIHIPLTTNDKSLFFLDQEKYHFEVGNAYEVNNGRNHRVINGGITDRIHLIFEYLNVDIQPQYIRNQIRQLDKD